MGERMNGGAVKDERSPENDAILVWWKGRVRGGRRGRSRRVTSGQRWLETYDLRKLDQLLFWPAGTPCDARKVRVGELDGRKV